MGSDGALDTDISEREALGWMTLFYVTDYGYTHCMRLP